MHVPIALLSASLLASLVASPALADPNAGDCSPDGISPVSEVSAAVRSAAAFDHAPGVAAFAKAWTRKFAACVRSAAGEDGRLSLSEAKRMDGACALSSDNAVHWLEATGQQSVDVDKLIRSGYSYAYATGKKAAGKDGRISLEDGAKLPEDLRRDYLSLRGIAGTDLAALSAAVEGLIYSSEGDASFVVLSASAEANTGPITAEKVRAAFAAEHDRAMRDGRVWGREDEEYMPLAERVPEERSFREWFEAFEEPTSGHPAAVEEAARFTALRKRLESELDDLTIFRFGERSSDEGDVITASTFIVGRAADGRLIAILTGAVET